MLRRELFCFYEFDFKFFSKNLKELPFIFSQIFFSSSIVFFTHQI